MFPCMSFEFPYALSTVCLVGCPCVSLHFLKYCSIVFLAFLQCFLEGLYKFFVFSLRFASSSSLGVALHFLEDSQRLPYGLIKACIVGYPLRFIKVSLRLLSGFFKVCLVGFPSVSLHFLKHTGTILQEMRGHTMDTY